MNQTLRIAVIGGTGPHGRGLAYRFARDGHTVTLGSRSAERAVAAAARLNVRLPDRKSTRLNSSHPVLSRMPSSA